MKRFLIGVTWLAAGLVPAWAAGRELTIHSDAGAPVGICDLGATLNIPQNAKALVVFVHGSGSQNRDEGLQNGPAPFRNIAEALSVHGIGSLRFDKRSSIKTCLPGMTDPSNPQRAHPGLLPEHFIKDIEAVYHRAKQEAQELPVYLLGHSEGVNYALELVAQQRLDPSGVILLAGLGRYPIDVTLLRQLRAALPKIEEALRDPGLSPEERQKLTKLRQQTQGWLKDGEVFFQKIRNGQAQQDDYSVGAYAAYWKEWIEITERATATAAKSGKPSLLIQGSLDANVTKDDFNALAAALKPAGGQSVYLNDLDHLFLKPGSDRVDASVPETIVAWIEGQMKGTKNAAFKPTASFQKNRKEPVVALEQLRFWLASPALRGF